MKGMKMIVVIVVMSFAAFGIVQAEHHDQAGTLDKGKAMFNDPKLGTTGKSCNDCHQNGKGLENAASKTDLEQIVNGCISRGLNGKPLDVKSPEMHSLVSYIKSFGGVKKQQGKKAAVGC
jgi:cytochrome c